MTPKGHMAGARPSESMARLVSIGIPTFNSAWSLPQVLDAVLKLRYENRLLRIIIVDNESSDGTRDIVEEFERTHAAEFESVVFVVERSGISKARNICIEKAAGSDFLFFIDSDVIPGPEAIIRLAPFLSDRDVGIAFQPYDSENSPGKLRFLVHAFNTPTGPTEAYKVAAGCTLLSMEMVSKVGLFNERLRVLEDGEYCFRARKSGYRIFCDFGYPARHLKRIRMDSSSYLGFVRDSAAFYVEMAVRGSKIYIARLLLSAGILVSFVALLLWPNLLPASVLVGLVGAAIVVNSSNKLWGDGSTIKTRYRPIVGVVFSVATLAITLGSVLAVYKRVAGSTPRGVETIENREAEPRRIPNPPSGN